MEAVFIVCYALKWEPMYFTLELAPLVKYIYAVEFSQDPSDILNQLREKKNYHNIKLVKSSEYYDNEQKTGEIARKITRIAKVIFVVALLTVFPLVLMREPLTGFVYGRGSISAQDLITIQTVFTCFLVGYISYSVGAVFTGALLTLKRTRFL